jgi:hypothetical protein
VYFVLYLLVTERCKKSIKQTMKISCMCTVPLRAQGVTTLLALLIKDKDFDILKDIELIWALKLKVGSKNMPLN